MFIIERRTAGVLAALAGTAAMAILGSVWDRVDEVASPSKANSTAAFATSVGPSVRPIAPGADAASTSSCSQRAPGDWWKTGFARCGSQIIDPPAANN
jgi:hypothetical protein